MRWLVKKIYVILIVVFIIVSIYFIITIIGSSKEIIQAYNRITYTKQEGADNIRSNFLQVYSTYGEELFIALGIKKTDFMLSGIGDSSSIMPDENVTPFCTCDQKCLNQNEANIGCQVCTEDYTKCVMELYCLCVGPDKCSSTHTDTNCHACIYDITLCEVIQGETREPNPPPDVNPNPPPQQSPGGEHFVTTGKDGLGIIPQNTASFNYYGNPNGGLSIADAGCGILAAYFAYANNGGTKSFEQTILETFGDRVEVKNGAIYNRPGKGFEMGLGTQDWNRYCSNLGLSIGSRVNSSIPTEPGDYIFRYTYGSSGQHNIFIRVGNDGSIKAACSANKSWQETISRDGFKEAYYMKVN